MVLRVERATAFLFACESEEKSGIHPFGGFFHLLAGEDAAEIFAEDDIDTTAQFGEESDGVDTHGQEQEEERSEPEEDASFHATQPERELAFELATKRCETVLATAAGEMR